MSGLCADGESYAQCGASALVLLGILAGIVGAFHFIWTIALGLSYEALGWTVIALITFYLVCVTLGYILSGDVVTDIVGWFK